MSELVLDMPSSFFKRYKEERTSVVRNMWAKLRRDMEPLDMLPLGEIGEWVQVGDEPGFHMARMAPLKPGMGCTVQ